MSQNTESQMLVALPADYIPEASRRCKIIVVGAKNAGKSTFIERVEFGKFHEEKQTEKLYRVIAKKVFEQTLTVELIEKDLGGLTNEDNGFKKTEMRDVDAVLLFYAADDLESFKQLKENLVHVQRKIPPNANITVVGTKADVKEMQVQWQEVDSFAENQGFSCFETSSKTGVNVEIILHDILETIFERRFASDDDEVLSNQPVYASTVLTSRQEEPPRVNGYCWMPNIPIFSFFRSNE
ncbi:NF-kappa-B inhibitor-interacting Ras-like protein 1 [Caenorhabditis elegans]|uniref:NF-kappa-B inhibitor-interacting Ras-like protein 1 n=1 Tax=Caenorhabditis elegans TaxID=6239 RepID=Q18773_CAEEL|nr:NF-kappa-B inhibitor-interacting Ras-like protein 1 [Caenorhabditis elegans]CCD65698.1 NF-kappa-B inhibitor-interacting Ras-like protein 1 [Caenorhabditis elegans]|eukprot:NP_508236.1 Uncharacterized protein CELE_C52B11.5 [Caenorhabditis elegans]